jgi:hypothetical protein
MGIQLADSLTSIQAPLNFSAPIDGKPARYVDAPTDGVYRNATQDDTHIVSVRNARPILGTLSLDVQGFAVLQQPTAVTNFYDPAQIRDIYYAEVEEMMREAAGAAHVIAFDHNIRNGQNGIHRDETGIRGPAKRVHNDYTLDSGPRRARELLPPEQADELLKHRFALINLWRPISLVEEAPLAICDARSIAPTDFVATDLKYTGRTGEIYSVTHNPAQRWYYVPRMRPDEAMLLKCYDSATNVARFTAHGAFDDPTSPADGRPRESIEVRTLVLY